MTHAFPTRRSADLRVTLRAGLGDEVLLVAGQAREPVQHRARPVLGLRREIHAHGHVAAEYLGAMPVDVLPSAEAGAVFDAFHGFLLVIRKAPLLRSGRGWRAMRAG